MARKLERLLLTNYHKWSGSCSSFSALSDACSPSPFSLLSVSLSTGGAINLAHTCILQMPLFSVALECLEGYEGKGDPWTNPFYLRRPEMSHLHPLLKMSDVEWNRSGLGLAE